MVKRLARRNKTTPLTNGDVFATITSEAIGQRLAQVRAELGILRALLPANTRLDDERDEHEAQQLLANLRNEMPGIRAWPARCEGVRG